MALAAAIVIDAVATRVRAVTGWSARVFTDRAFAFDDTQLPAAKVMAGDEVIGGQTVHAGAVQTHDLDIDVEIHVRAVTDLDDAMHNAAAAVLTKLHDNAAISALGAAGVQSWRQTSTLREMQAGGEAAIGVITLRHQARFCTLASAPETILGAAP
jgi:hypothetical protein